MEEAVFVRSSFFVFYCSMCQFAEFFQSQKRRRMASRRIGVETVVLISVKEGNSAATVAFAAVGVEAEVAISTDASPATTAATTSITATASAVLVLFFEKVQ